MSSGHGPQHSSSSRHGRSLDMDPSQPQPPGHETNASDIWWPSLETRSKFSRPKSWFKHVSTKSDPTSTDGG